MGDESLRDIIAFAVKREQEAVDFYEGLASKVRSEAIADELKKMAAMEMGHKRKLENMDLEGFVSKPSGDLQDLKIADYTVTSEPSEGMGWQDVVNIAMHRELASVKLYTDLAGMVSDPTIKALFEGLAGEEMGHKNYLETIWDEEVMRWN